MEPKETTIEFEETEELLLHVDKKFIDKIAMEFADSIKSGDLYRELKGKGNSGNNS
jgi:hypothetical protein